jgi:hypothetical protein
LKEVQPGLIETSHGIIETLEYEHQFIIFINLAEIRNEVKNLHNHQENVKNTCEKFITETDGFCASIDNLKQLIFRIDFDLENLKTHRAKRGLINFGGEVLNFVGGVMSDSDRKEIEKAIKTVQDQNIDVLKEVDKNLRFIDDTARHLNYTIETIEKNEKVYKEYFDESNKLLQKLDYQSQGIIIKESIIFNVISMMISADNIQTKLKEINFGLNDANNNIFTSNIYPLDEIIGHMKSVTLENNQKWIVDLVNPDLGVLKHLTRVNAITDKDDNIYYILSIPFVTEKLEMLEIHNVPKLQDNKIFYIDVDSKFIATDAKRSKYSDIRDSYINKCVEAGEVKYCEIISVFRTDEDCILALLNKKTSKIHELCTFRLGGLGKSTIIEQVNKQSVIITTDHQQTGRIISENYNDQVILKKGASLLNITNEKRIQLIIDDYEINLFTAKQTKSSIFPLNLNIKISALIEEHEDYLETAHLPTLEGVKIIDKAKLKNQMMTIKEYENNVNRSIEKLQASKHTFIKDTVLYSMICVIVIILLSLYVFAKCKFIGISKLLNRDEEQATNDNDSKNQFRRQTKNPIRSTFRRLKKLTKSKSEDRLPRGGEGCSETATETSTN